MNSRKDSEKGFRQSGLTMVEMVIAILVLSLVAAGLVSSYMAVQKSWTAGGKQMNLQSQARVGLSEISKNIRAAEDVLIGDDGKSITVVRLGGYDRDPVSRARYEHKSETRQIVVYPNWPETTGETVLIENVVAQPQMSGQIFERDTDTRTVFIRIRVEDDNPADGYQGADISLGVRPRNH